MSVIPSSLHLLSLLAIVGLLARSPTAASTNRNFLASGESLQATDALTTPDFSFVMEANCNLVLYHQSTAVWSTHTRGKGDGCYVTMHTNGNLVLYNKLADPLWASNSWSRRGKYVLVLQKDGNAVIYGWSRWITTVSSPIEAKEEEIKSMDALPDPINVLYPGETLKSGQSLMWRANRLTMQPECSLVFYQSDDLVWNTKTNGKGTGCYLAFETDGNVVVYDNKNNRIWGLEMVLPRGNYVLIVMDKPKLGIYGPDRWSTNWDDINGKKAMATSQ